VVNGKVSDAYFSLVVRRGDDSLPTDPQAVHALLSAGRAALRLRTPAADGRDGTAAVTRN
jgi:hypothetical protein